ncbi:hypothetical protein BaRGS_00021927 [Batillaria attramentaria]|uniref:F-box only protein 22 n=1 Tax=Batillaria attramentaria TaxID=370345 RepID=A0ABD0KHU8_9CAEN
MAEPQRSDQGGGVRVDAAVLGFPNIVKHIFEFLPAKTLCSAARVSKLWKHQIEIVLRQRRQYYWELFESEGGKNHVAVLSSVEQFILDLPVCPSLILVLSTDKLWKKKYSSSSDSGHAHSSHHKKKQTLAERLAAIVPPRCKIICSSTYGIIGTSSNLARTKEIEHSEAVAVLCFGLHPGLEFVPIDLNPVLFRDKLESLDFNRSDTEQAIQREDFGFLPPCPDIKAMLMCCNEICDPKIGQMLYTYFKKPLIVGGFVNHLCTNSYSYRECLSDMNIDYHELGDNEYLSCLGVTGDKVQAASVIFPPYLTTPEDADTVVQTLKEKAKDMPLDHTVAFMFACVARGMQCYGSYNVESSAFRKYFPKVPIFGFFGNGEIGFEYPREEKSEKPPDLFHSYTTFIVLLSLS